MVVRKLVLKDKLRDENQKLRYALQRALEVLREYEDTRDGSDGLQLPNSAMLEAMYLEHLLAELE